RRTAATGRPVVTEHEALSSSQLLLVFDFVSERDAEGSVAAKNSKYFEYGLAAMGSLTEVFLAKGMAVGVAVGERYVLPGSSTSHWRSVLHALAELKLQPQHIWNYPV